MDYKNSEGYADPTPYQAISNISKKRYRPLVYICSPYSGDVDGNTIKARAYSRFAVDSGYIPFAPHLLLPQYMDELTERDLAMFMDIVFLGHCSEIWVFGDISEGMASEIARAEKQKKRIRYFTDEMKECAECK